MKFINKLERKFGKYAIKDLMKYIIALYAMGLVVAMSPGFYEKYLMLDIAMILKGQVWRLVTFLIQPVSMNNILFLLIELYLYYMIGTSLERTWGTFKFNFYFLTGILLNFLAVLIIYIVTYFLPGIPATSPIFGLTYINRSLFFAFAMMFPDMQFLLMFILPIKAKYLGYAFGAVFALEVVQNIIEWIKYGNIFALFVAISIIVALGNFLILFFIVRKQRKPSLAARRRKASFKKKIKKAEKQGHQVQHKGKEVITRHKCTTCGLTELDDYDLEFRFCSRCKGSHEYCMEHLFTHEHIK